jgi:hypothetical protein
MSDSSFHVMLAVLLEIQIMPFMSRCVVHFHGQFRTPLHDQAVTFCYEFDGRPGPSDQTTKMLPMYLSHLVDLWSTVSNAISWKCSVGLESRDYGRRDPSLWPRGILYQQKLTLTSPTSGGCSVDIVRSRTKAMEFSFSLVPWIYYWPLEILSFPFVFDEL